MDWETNDRGIPYHLIYGMDPFAHRLLEPGSPDFTRGQDNTLIPFIYAPLERVALSIFNEALLVHLESQHIKILFPQLYDRSEVKVGDYIMAFAQKSFFDALATSSNEQLMVLRDAEKQIKLSLPLKEQSLPENHKPGKLDDPPLPKGTFPPNTVLVGIIDDGIAFAHDRFRTADGKTRVQFFWRQDGPYENNISTVDFGREIWKESLGPRKGIDELLADCTTAGLVDEEKLYRIARLIDFSLPEHKAAALNRAHGTLVLDLAAGYNPSSAPDNMPIIAVQLPVATTADTSGSGLEAHVKAAVKYILDRARRLAGNGPPLPVVINFSYGTIAGPHDGTSALEASFDKSITDRSAPLNLVLPAGNSHLSRCHAEIMFAQPTDTVTLNWRVQPDDMTLTHMEIWMPHDTGSAPTTSRVAIHVETPLGLRSGVLGEMHGALIQLTDNGEVLAKVSYSFMQFPTERGVFCISLLPTARLRPLEPGRRVSSVAPSGIWKIHVSNVSLSDCQRIHAWIQRDDTIYGYRQRGRQSYFEDEYYRRYDPITGDFVISDYEEDSTVPPCHVKRRGLINAIATGSQTTVIGGVYRKELTVVEYSAGGPITGTRGAVPHRAGPDALAVSDDSRVHRGVIAAGSRSGSAVEMNGTSVAAPQITRELANLMASRLATSDRQSIRQLAAQQEMARPGRPQMPSEIVGGEGRIITARPDRPPRYDADT